MDKELAEELRRVTRPIERDMLQNTVEILANMRRGESNMPDPDETLVELYEIAENAVENARRRIA